MSLRWQNASFRAFFSLICLFSPSSYVDALMHRHPPELHAHTNNNAAVPTVEHEQLCIVMEYMENGALTQVMKQFGSTLPEPLVARYIAQVLEGLAYLHSQGVLHRYVPNTTCIHVFVKIMCLSNLGTSRAQMSW